MDSENIHREEKYFDELNRLCAMLDFFVSTDIEEKMIFSLGSYAKGTIAYIESLPFEILFPGGFRLNQLGTMLSDVYYYDGEKGFSKRQRWIDFVACANTVNAILKDDIKKNDAIVESLTMQGQATNLENMHKELQVNAIRGLGEMFDLLVSPDIEEKKIDALDCYITFSVGDYIDCLTDSCADEVYSIIGERELIALRQLRKVLRKLRHHYGYDEEQGYEKGFSKTQSWLDLVNFVNKVNVLLKDAVKKYHEKICTEG